MFKSINLGSLRRWIQWNCVRGDSIIFGSDEEVHFRGQFTYKEFEKITSKVVIDNKKELVKEFLRIIDMQKNAESCEDLGEKHWNRMRVDTEVKEMKDFLENS